MGTGTEWAVGIWCFLTWPWSSRKRGVRTDYWPLNQWVKSLCLQRNIPSKALFLGGYLSAFSEILDFRCWHVVLSIHKFCRPSLEILLWLHIMCFSWCLPIRSLFKEFSGVEAHEKLIYYLSPMRETTCFLMFTCVEKEDRWEQAALELTGLNRRNKCFTSIQVVLFGGQRRKYIWEGLAQFQEKSKQEH